MYTAIVYGTSIFVCNTNSMRDVDLTLAGNVPSRGDSRIKIRHRGNAKAQRRVFAIY